MTFTIPWESFIGGTLLGLSASLLMLFSGKIAGISGIINGLLNTQDNERSWKALFVVGMVLSFLLVEPFAYLIPDTSGKNVLQVLIAGLLVGFGTRLGNGCTSGHGIVGMGRFSKRSIYATLTFMGVAVLIVFLRRQFGIL